MALDIKTLRQQPAYQVSTTSDQLAIELKSLSQVDAAVEQQLRKANILLGVGIGVTFVSFFLFVFGVGFATLPVGLGLALWGGVIRQRLGSVNIPNYRYELVTQVLEMVCRDMDPQQKVNLRLVLTPCDRAEKKIDTIPHPTRPKWNIDRYEDAWLELTSEFLDGTRFTLRATELFQSHHGWKRSRSGKNKHKRKPKPKGHRLSLSLAFSRRKYGAVTVLSNDIQGAVQLPPSARLKEVEAEDNKLTLVVKSTPPPATSDLYQTISLMFLSAYQVLNLSRELSKQP